MIQVRLIERGADPAWEPAVASLVSTPFPEVSVQRTDSLLTLPAVDFYLWVGRSIADLEHELQQVEGKEPDRCRRTIVLGVPLDFAFGDRSAPPGTLVHVLETYRLAGAFGPQALTAWNDSPSSFASPKDWMSRLVAMPVKALSTRHYAAWFATRGDSLGVFLFGYLRAIAKLAGSGDGGAAGGADHGSDELVIRGE